MRPDAGAQRIAVQRQLGLTGSLHKFVRMSWNEVEPSAPFSDNWSIGAMCEHLEAIDNGQIRKLVINVPPGGMKSLTVGVFWPVWAWIRKPGVRWLFASYDVGLTARDNGKALRLLQSPWFQDRWADRVQLRVKDPAVGYYENTAGGFRFATSLKGKATGRHPHRQVIDDPVKPGELTKTSLEFAQNWLRQTMSSRYADLATGVQVLIMQRLHEDDPAGYVLREGGYTHLRLPMRYEEKYPCVTVLGRADPRTTEGELLWPARFPEEALAEQERTMGPNVVAAQLQQRPAPAGGAVFRREWFRTWVTKGSDTTHLGADAKFKEVPTQWDQLIQSWDCAFKGTSTSDYVVGQVWGRSGADYYLLHQVRERLDFQATLSAIRTMTLMWPAAHGKLVEDKANGSAVISTLQAEIPGLIPVNPEGGKEARANAVTPYFAAGNVYYPDAAGGLSYAWVPEAIAEATSFPFARHDDSVDCLTQALHFMSDNAQLWLAAWGKVARGPA